MLIYIFGTTESTSKHMLASIYKNLIISHFIYHILRTNHANLCGNSFELAAKNHKT